MIKRLIINADDFGFSRSVTDGIIQAHVAGILTSTTLMTTMPDCDRAMELAQCHSNLGVGIHLCLTQGTPRSKHLRYLTRRENQFPRKIRPLLMRVSFNVKALDEVRQEWAAQIEYALHRGLRPTHLDSHKHVHHWPKLGAIAAALALQYGIGYIRCADDIRPKGFPGLSPGYRVLGFLARRLKSRLTQQQLQTTDWFYGLAATGRFSKELWLRLFDQLPSGTGEVMVHPGYPDDLDQRSTRLTHQRRLELEGLCDPMVRTRASSGDIKLAHYGTL